MSTPLQATRSDQFPTHSAIVNEVRLHYRIGRSGSPVMLLHGFAETGHMWYPLLTLLAARHTVVVPDLRGAGASDKPLHGYDKKTMAEDIYALARSLGVSDNLTIVGRDIGLMVAYAYAARHPGETGRVVLMDAFLPGVGNWKDMWLLRDLWHFYFYGEVPLALFAGRERIYLEHFWNDFAADRVIRCRKRTVSVMRPTMPSGIAGAGHWLIEEAPDKVLPVLQAYVH